MRIIALPLKLLIRNHRLAGAGDGSHGVRGTPELRRPERSGDRMASGGRQNCDDRVTAGDGNRNNVRTQKLSKIKEESSVRRYVPDLYQPEKDMFDDIAYSNLLPCFRI